MYLILFFREYFYVSSSKTNSEKIQNNIGVMIGLSVGLVFLGLIIGAGTIIAYLKRKNMI
ncbi:hypothetical protein BpHYR1_052016 [Brachionus plicatilis]|uniref:Uncharacterized protein n=1 Tax=Brachionus plicatilis TaxID=10195 RepID=A0A3M7PKS3_BRAPC|nr:hypothetical protein BpHYR1_052016 [Brachionus plicatilis]